MNLLTSSFLIPFFLLLIFPVYAQEESELKDVSSLEDLNKSLTEIQNLIKEQTSTIENTSIILEQFENMRTQTMIVAGIEAALIGAAVALIGQNYVMRKSEIKKIKKTKNLILDDVTRIYGRINQTLPELETLRSTIQTTQNIQQEILQNEGLSKKTFQDFL
ncbi:MAG: hypothetical protein IIC67_01105 [Thaumarchaeota archaeon]|nr:hypothetical protein [Nitrososphaerota archaeon]